ncbi:hypothetical protein HMPREF1360_02732 [Enterococcus faecium E422]|nr:hypothetical protein HMPREF1360_02732 [Enterococcus faecium E422]
MSQPLLNGVQSTDPRYSLKKRQNIRSYFVWLFLLLDAGQLFHDL